MRYLILFALLIPYTMSAQIDMNVNKSMGGGEVLKIVSSNQITFADVTQQDVIYINKKDGTTDTYKLSDVNMIVFEGITGVADFIPDLFKLDNYPNPFEQKTTIAFTLEKVSNIELSIFDINGNMIKALINDIYNSGNHKIDWDGTNSRGMKVTNGNYFYQLKVDNSVVTKQMIIIK